MYYLSLCYLNVQYLSIYITNNIIQLLQNIELMPNELKLTIDLSRFMNPSPYIVQHVSKTNLDE